VRAGTVTESIDALVRGVRAMSLAILVLVLAWSIGKVMEDLRAGAYVAGALGDTLPAWTLPSLTFILAGLIALATGTSWGTMAILFPIVIPLVAAHRADPAFEAILLGTASAILGGSVFGDHCSPISDTTVLSSIASASDHVDHTRTQAPYALLCAAVTLGIGYIPLGFGLSPWVSMGVGLVVLFAVLRLFGRVPE
jgi:Na+/H+ antiporter NhaC